MRDVRMVIAALLVPGFVLLATAILFGVAMWS